MKTFTREEWTQVRAKGHARFVLVHGLLRSGIPFGLLMAVVDLVWALLTHSTPSVWRMTQYLLVFTIVYGYLSGEMQWRRCEKDYHDNAA
jgi:hypothetical protein